ncbi:MAG: cupredoxin domain-containing protein [Candidatus Hydrothermarchaeales archaeon]
MIKSSHLEKLFIIVAVLILILMPYSLYRYRSTGNGKTLYITGQNPVGESPGKWIVNNEGWDFHDRGEGKDEIRVKKGEKVTLKVTSIDVVHVFTIQEYNISEAIYPGEIKTIEFVPDKEGVFEFYCKRGCGLGHLEMKGKLVVEP